jgi:hypothetical protein
MPKTSDRLLFDFEKVLRCIKCGGPADDETEIAESEEDAERLYHFASAIDEDLAGRVLERAAARIALQRAGLCMLDAVQMRDAARDGRKGWN